MRYTVAIERDETTGSYGAYVPELPGCGVAADTLAEVQILIHEAIQFHIEGLIKSGLPVPEATTQEDYVETQIPT